MELLEQALLEKTMFASPCPDLQAGEMVPLQVAVAIIGKVSDCFYPMS